MFSTCGLNFICAVERTVRSDASWDEVETIQKLVLLEANGAGMHILR